MSSKNPVETHAKPARANPAAPTRTTSAGSEPTEEQLDEQDDLDLDLDLVDGDIESSGQHAGMGRGEKPRKLKSEEK